MLYITFKSSIGKLNALYHHSTNPNSPVVIVVDNYIPDVKTQDTKAQDTKAPDVKTQDTKTTVTNFDKALDKVVETFINFGFSTMKFTCRHVATNEKKDGKEENGNLLDLTAALDWLHTKNIESKNFWICGFDTGVISTLQLVMRRPEVENYILISPNFKKNDLSFIVPCSASGLLVRASEDLKFLEEDCINLQEKLMTKTESKIKYITVYNTERNYESNLEQLKNEIGIYIKEKMQEDYNNLKSISINKRRRRKKKIQDGDGEKPIYVNPIKPLDIDDI